MPSRLFYKLLLLLPAFLLVTTLAFAQQDVADSLKRNLGFSNDTTRVNMLLRLSDAYLKFSPRKAIDPANEALILSVQLGNDQLQARSHQEIGIVNYKIGNFTEAINSLDKARRIYLQTGMKKNAASLLISMANCYRDKGNYNEALNQSFAGYREFEALNDKGGMSGALIVSGNVYRAMKNYNKAIADYEKALKLSREGGDKQNEASALNNLSNVYSIKGDNQKAIGYLEQSRKIYEQLGDKFNLAKVLNNIGTVYEANGQYDDATNYYLQSLDLRKQIGDKRGMATALGNLGHVSLEQHKPDKAIDYLNRALDHAQKAGAMDLQMDILEYLSNSYSELGDHEKALQFFRQYSNLKDSVYNENLSQSIAEMQARYDVEKAESETRAQEKEKRFIFWTAVGGGVMLLVILFVIWNRAVTRKRANERLSQQKLEIEHKNAELYSLNRVIELKNKDITDSIIYARKIQEAILPEVEFMSTFGEKGFVLYRPKDIVSGDFYWMAQTETHLLFAAVDCTGHGVPGAFMSLVCSTLLSQSVNEHGLLHPDEILNDVNMRLSETLRQRQDDSRVRDGMDIALCVLDRKSLKLEFSGAFNPAWILRGQEITELAGDKFPVGHFIEEEWRKFTRKEFQLQPGDRIYVFSDGYSDQFGGALGKKYKRSVFQNFVSNLQRHPLNLHRQLLEKEHLDWKGDNDQIDDILVLGVEV